jgi:hypothetical protein
MRDNNPKLLEMLSLGGHRVPEFEYGRGDRGTRSNLKAPYATKKPRTMPGLLIVWLFRPDQYFATTGPPQLKR